jgi:hypothetical protein
MKIIKKEKPEELGRGLIYVPSFQLIIGRAL